MAQFRLYLLFRVCCIHFQLSVSTLLNDVFTLKTLSQLARLPPTLEATFWTKHSAVFSS